MAVTETFTVGEIVDAALRKIGVVAIDEAASADDTAAAVSSLNWMLKGWQRKKWLTWTYASGSLALTTAASYALAPVRPIRILNARLKQSSGIEIPMVRLTRDEYDTLPDKTTTGIPTQFHYDRQRETAQFIIWPVLSAPSGETVEYTYEREIEDISGTPDTLDIPVEWAECVIYSLASRLADDYALNVPKVDARAAQLFEELMAEDREESVFLGCEPYE